MSKEIIKRFEEETGLKVKTSGHDEEELLFSARDIYKKLYYRDSDSEEIVNYRYRDWVQINLVNARDSEGNNIFTNYRQIKVKMPVGRPMIDYLINEEDAKVLITRSNSPIGIELLRRLIRLEKEISGFVKQRLAGKVSFIALTDSIKNDHDPAKGYHYSNEVNMIYRIMFGMDAKELRTARNVPEDEDLRDYFSAEELKILQRFEIKNTVYIDDGMEYQERKTKLAEWFNKIQSNNNQLSKK
jgi:hypothetical protein